MEGKPKRRGCTGCLIAVLVVVALLALGYGLIRFGVVKRLGLTKARPPEVMLAAPPERETAREISEVLTLAGMPEEGVEVHVLKTVEDRTVAVIMLDEAGGFDVDQLLNADTDSEWLDELLDGDLLIEEGVDRLGVNYYDKDGKTVFTFTAETDKLQQYADGEIDEEEMLGEIMGYADPAAIARELRP